MASLWLLNWIWWILGSDLGGLVERLGTEPSFKLYKIHTISGEQSVPARAARRVQRQDLNSATTKFFPPANITYHRQ